MSEGQLTREHDESPSSSMSKVSSSEAQATRRSLREAARRRWKPTVLTCLTVMTAVAGLTALVYPDAASWVSALNQSGVVENYDDSVAQAQPDEATQLAAARDYNQALSSGVLLAAGANVPQGNGTTTDPEYDYDKMLATSNGVMARLQIPKISVDLPIYHGTSDQTLMEGAGHLKGTSLPVGGEGTHAVITAHRGLAEAKMFTDLDQIVEGDRFSITVFGEVLTYRVVSTKVVAPEDTATLRAEPGRDLVTLITCTPLGINSHRILVTAERVYPTPKADVAAAKEPVRVPFPWWMIVYGGGLLAIGVYLWRMGYARRR